MPNANNHGGARTGAGRPPKALRYADTAALVEERIADALPDIIGRMIERAREGDVAAARYLTDRLLGRTAAVTAPPADDRRLEYTEADAQSDQSVRDLTRW